MRYRLLSSLLSKLALLVAFLSIFPIRPAFDQMKHATTKPLPVILDDDGSPDGVIAMLYMLQNPKFSVKAITVVQGEAHPNLFAQNLMRVLARIGVTGIPVAAGDDFPLQGSNAFPDSWRTDSDNFWGIALPEAVESVQSISAVKLIIQTVKHSPQPITILATGPLTNIAQALRIDPSIAKNISRVQLMGGAVYAPGNLSEFSPTNNTSAEWNIWVDPVAATEVFLSGVPVYLTPLDATNKVKMTAVDAAAWRTIDTPSGILAAELLSWLLRVISPSGVSNWDTVAAINLSEPSFCPETPLHLDVITQPGSEQGRTVENKNKPSNVNVCLNPDLTALPNGFGGIFLPKGSR